VLIEAVVVDEGRFLDGERVASEMLLDPLFNEPPVGLQAGVAARRQARNEQAPAAQRPAADVKEAMAFP